ncbi:MAG: flagellar basal-body rod protein FlgG [bacterium]
MQRGLYTAASGMRAQQLNIDTIANNLSNVNTTGFKQSRVEFQDLLYQTLKAAGAPIGGGGQVPTGIQVGHGTRPGATQKIFLQGSFQNTGNPLDVAIEGHGFFQVILPDGTTAYTRDGSFKIDSTGRLVTSDGFFLEPEITIPSDAIDISISPGGVVSVTIAGTPEEIGQLQLARFINPAGLSSLGKNLYRQTQASGDPIIDNPGQSNLGLLEQGFLEMSNVQVVDEMVNMITAHKAYDVNSKSIQTVDSMLATAINLKR